MGIEIIPAKINEYAVYSDQWWFLPNAPHVFCFPSSPVPFFLFPFRFSIRCAQHTTARVCTIVRCIIYARINKSELSYREVTITLGKIHAVKRHIFAALATFPFARAGQLLSTTVIAVNLVVEVLQPYCMCCVLKCTSRARNRASWMSD